jgi:hypothetical protein
MTCCSSSLSSITTALEPLSDALPLAMSSGLDRLPASSSTDIDDDESLISMTSEEWGRRLIDVRVNGGEGLK